MNTQHTQHASRVQQHTRNTMHTMHQHATRVQRHTQQQRTMQCTQQWRAVAQKRDAVSTLADALARGFVRHPVVACIVSTAVCSLLPLFATACGVIVGCIVAQ